KNGSGDKVQPVRPRHRPLFWLPSISDADSPSRRHGSAEPAAELSLVSAVHVAVPVEVEVPQVTGVAGGRLEGRTEEGSIQPVHVPVAVAIAKEAEESVGVVAARRAVAAAVELSPEAVADPVAVEEEGIVAVRQRAGKDAGAGESEDRHGLAARHGRGDIEA